MPPFAVSAEIVPERTDFERFSLDAVESAPTRRGIAIWRLLRASRRFPAHDDLELKDIADIMPYMSLVAVIDGGKDFENRFVGDAVVRAHDVPIRHRRFSDVAKDMPTLMEGLLPLFRKVVETGEPLAAALELERRLLEPLKEQAAWIIDTSTLNVHQLKARVMQAWDPGRSRRHARN